MIGPNGLAPGASANVLLEVHQLSYAYGRIQALKEVSMTLHRGEITALVGDNGAGKSTLIRCVCGILRPQGGQMLFEGHGLDLRSAEDAREAGIETVHQNLALVEDLTVWQNLFLNRELVTRIGPFAFLARGAMRRRASEMLSALTINIPSVQAPVRRLSGGQRQAVAICRATGFSSKLIIMDEPTAALGVQETALVEELILKLRSEGHSVLLVSHNFDQVMRLTDQVWVMRAGRCVGGRRTVQTDGQEIVGMITGVVSA